MGGTYPTIITGGECMKLICEIELPDNASFKTKLDAMASAAMDESKWREVFSKAERERRTSLEGKCGSCAYFEPKPQVFAKYYGDCQKGHAGYRQRSCKACVLYERKENT